MPPTLIVITGLPASGKTTLGHWLAKQVNLPYFYKDGFKEKLFNTVGWSDVAASKQLGAISTQLLFYVAEVMAEAGHSLILESNFVPERAELSLMRLHTHYEVRFIQVLCWANPATLVQRHRERVTRKMRHPGHLDALRLPEAEQVLQVPMKPMSLPGPLFELDTSDVAQIDYKPLLAKVRSALTSL